MSQSRRTRQSYFKSDPRVVRQ